MLNPKRLTYREVGAQSHGSVRLWIHPYRASDCQTAEGSFPLAVFLFKEGGDLLQTKLEERQAIHYSLTNDQATRNKLINKEN